MGKAREEGKGGEGWKKAGKRSIPAPFSCTSSTASNNLPPERKLD